jgi:hypothetical protein
MIHGLGSQLRTIGASLDTLWCQEKAVRCALQRRSSGPPVKMPGSQKVQCNFRNSAVLSSQHLETEPESLGRGDGGQRDGRSRMGPGNFGSITLIPFQLPAAQNLGLETLVKCQLQ